MTHKAQHPGTTALVVLSASQPSEPRLAVTPIWAIAKEFAQVHLALREKTRGSLQDLLKAKDYLEWMIEEVSLK